MAPLAAILALSLITAEPPDEPPWYRSADPSGAVAGLMFDRAMEESVRSIAADIGHPGIPEPWRSSIAALGAREWKSRDAASKALLGAIVADRGAERWLIRGRLDRDPEIRVRCNAILRRLHTCEPCKGSGGMTRSWGWDECWDCHASGTLWPFSPWD